MRRRDPRSAGTVGLLDAAENVAPIVSGLLGIPTEDEGRQMGLLDQAFLKAHASGDRRGMAEAIGQQAALYGPNMLGAGTIRAFHGSPHSFDKFKMDKIGTGEGAQAYGHGLYFAENEGVAQSYRQALQRVDTAPFDSIGIPPKDWNAARMFAQNMDMSQPDIAARDFAQWTGREVTPDLIDAFKKAKTPGSMYEVNINANPDDFLDWDKPLSEQPESVRRAFVNTNTGDDPILRDLLDTSPEGMMMQGMVPNAKGSAAYRTLVERGNADGAIGEHLGPNGPPMKTGDKWATESLAREGVPGIKYFDGNSRGNGEGSRNYVVFDENLISIVKKYGIAGALSAGLLTNEQAQAFMAQQDDQGAANP